VTAAIFPPVCLPSARELKARADFIAIASQYTQLRRAGRQFVGLCPFHPERHPSCYVEPEKRIWKCFGCGLGGDIFAFVMRAEGCDFFDALRIVAGFSGVASESGPRSGPRFRASVGAAPSAAKRQSIYSQSTQESRAGILAALEATDRRVRAIEAVNRAAALELATACEPERSEVGPRRAFSTRESRITVREFCTAIRF
jgi:DNA primase